MATKADGKSTRSEKAGEVEKAESKVRTRNLPLAEAKEVFLDLLRKHGRLDRNDAKRLMAPLGFAPTAPWTRMCRELEAEGLVRMEKSPEHEDRLAHYVLSTGKARGKGKTRIAEGAASASHKA